VTKPASDDGSVMRRAPGLDGDAPKQSLDRGTRKALRRVQRRLERYYGLEGAPNVVDFTSVTREGEREVLLIREVGEEIEMALRVPSGAHRADPSDAFLQLCEGVSHFVYVAERVRVGLPATQLELELQAEVDKFVLLALEAPNDDVDARGLHERLYGNVTYLHAPGTEEGERYRLANALAARLAAKMLRRNAGEVRGLLQKFYRAGQTGKIEFVRAA
jgi:hypothetical protein